MKSMKLVLENWNRYIEQEEKQETIEEGIFKNLALALGLMMGSPAMGSTPTPEPATTTQVVKSSDKETDQTLQELSEIARDIHLFMSANSIGAAKEKVKVFKDVSSKFEGIDMTGINAKLDGLIVKATNPQTHDEGVKDLLNFANQMKILSDKY